MSTFLQGLSFGLSVGLLRSNPMFGCYYGFTPNTSLFLTFPQIPIINRRFHFDFSKISESEHAYSADRNSSRLNFSDWDFGNLYDKPTPKFDFSNIITGKLTNPTATTTDNTTETSAKTNTNNGTQKTTIPGNIPNHWSKMTDEQMKTVYGNYDTDITVLYTGTAEKLNKFLDSTGSKLLKNKGSVFMEAQRKYGISALVLIAICGAESTYGTKGKNNAFFNVANRRSGKNSFKHYNNVDDAIMDLARDLKQNYVDNPPEKKDAHLTKLYQVNARYCPVQADNNTGEWASSVTRCLNDIKRAVA